MCNELMLNQIKMTDLIWLLDWFTGEGQQIKFGTENLNVSSSY